MPRTDGLSCLHPTYRREVEVTSRTAALAASIDWAQHRLERGERHDQGPAPQRLALSRFRGDAEVLRGLHGLPLASALAIETAKTGRGANVLHTFFEMGDGSYLAFFEVPGQPFEFKRQHDFDLHIALEVDRQTLMEMFERGKAQGIETRGVSDHGFIDSVYFRDTDGYVVELTTKTAEEHELLDRERARATLDQWQAAKA